MQACSTASLKTTRSMPSNQRDLEHRNKTTNMLIPALNPPKSAGQAQDGSWSHAALCICPTLCTTPQPPGQAVSKLLLRWPRQAAELFTAMWCCALHTHPGPAIIDPPSNCPAQPHLLHTAGAHLHSIPCMRPWHLHSLVRYQG